MSRLWTYNLHYFDWLRQSDSTDAVAADHSRQWVARNPPFSGVGWEPYPTSLRIVNWVQRFGPDAPGGLVDSLALQAGWLDACLEHHLRANHLFANAKALLFAGTWLSGPFADRLLRRGWSLLEAELAEQFLPDGGHFERSPMYHVIMTADLAELESLIANHDDCFPSRALDLVSRHTDAALAFAHGIACPDGGLPYFNDTAAGIAPAILDIERYRGGSGSGGTLGVTAKRTTIDFPDSGYFGLREHDNFLVVDCGPPGAGYQPGHAHCDLLSFELWLHGRRVVANCGIHDYEVGESRTFSRSTRAHSTVMIDDSEQSEIWGAFRLGRRASPRRAEIADDGGSFVFEGAHDGYRHLPGQVTHLRRVIVDAGFRLQVRDEVTGRGHHSATSRVHFAPGLTLSRTQEGFAVRGADGSTLAQVVDVAADLVDTELTSRFPEFGVQDEGVTLVMKKSGPLPMVIDFSIRPRA